MQLCDGQFCFIHVLQQKLMRRIVIVFVRVLVAFGFQKHYYYE